MIGFTGTQVGITTQQRSKLRKLLTELDYPKLLFHGDCIGADAEAHQLALSLDYLIEIFPPENNRKRAFCTPYAAIHAPMPYLERNHAIVDRCKVLIACPKGYEEELRSGTWATVRYARKRNKPVIIIIPDGKELP